MISKSFLIHKAVNNKYITNQEASSSQVLEAADTVISRWKEHLGEDGEIGTSDFTQMIKEFLEELGQECYFEKNVLKCKTKKMQESKKTDLKIKILKEKIETLSGKKVSFKKTEKELKEERIKQKKIKLIKERLELLTGKKVIMKESTSFDEFFNMVQDAIEQGKDSDETVKEINNYFKISVEPRNPNDLNHEEYINEDVEMTEDQIEQNPDMVEKLSDKNINVGLKDDNS